MSDWLSLFFKTHMGRRLLRAGVRRCPEEAYEILGADINRRAAWTDFHPQRRPVKEFTDLVGLFWCSPFNRGLIRLDLDEAAYLFNLVRSLDNPLVVEIGRFKGGSTFLLAAAMRGGRLISLDWHVKMDLDKTGQERDAELVRILHEYGFADRVSLIVADSRTYDHRDGAVDCIFIDGDHSYEGVRADTQHWWPLIKKGGHVLFHDAAATRPMTTIHEGVARWLDEMPRIYPDFRIVDRVGSLVHGVKDTMDSS